MAHLNQDLCHPKCYEKYPIIHEYMDILRSEVQHLPTFEKFNAIEYFLGQKFIKFFHDYKTSVNWTYLSFNNFFRHVYMELRRRRNHLSYSRNKHYKRLHSIVSFCSCEFCRILFRKLHLNWNLYSSPLTDLDQFIGHMQGELMSITLRLSEVAASPPPQP